MSRSPSSCEPYANAVRLAFLGQKRRRTRSATSTPAAVNSVVASGASTTHGRAQDLPSSCPSRHCTLASVLLFALHNNVTLVACSSIATEVVHSQLGP